MKYFKLFEQFVNELNQTPVSGTKSGWTTSLDNKKYELKKDVKGAQIGDFANVVLPKGTIIHNLPGGVFADHVSLKNKYTTKYSSNGPEWFDKPTFSGVSIRQMPDVLKDIEKNSKVLESLNEAKVINKKTGKDITKHLLDFMEKKITKEEFEKLTGLTKESVDKSVNYERVAEGAYVQLDKKTKITTNEFDKRVAKAEKSLNDAAVGSIASGGGYYYTKVKATGSGWQNIASQRITYAGDVANTAGAFTNFKIDDSKANKSSTSALRITKLTNLIRSYKEDISSGGIPKSGIANIKKAIAAWERELTQLTVNEENTPEGKLINYKTGESGYVSTGGSNNSKDWEFLVTVKGKGNTGKYGINIYPYPTVKKYLKPSKDQDKTGFEDYLKQSGRIWDNVNSTNRESIITEADFKHINKTEHKIKLAIKDVEKKARLKANRGKPIEYEQLSLNKIMLSKVLGRERLGKEHQDAWEKLKKEYALTE